MSEQTEKPIKKKYFDHISVAKRTKQAVHFVEQHDKDAMLECIIRNSADKQIVVIPKSKRRADELSSYLKSKNLEVAIIHGNHRESEKEESADAFISGKIKILITTDMILQSLNLTNIDLIISYDIPTQAENYFSSMKFVDEKGESIILVTPEEEKLLQNIEFLMKLDIPQEEVSGFSPTEPSLDQDNKSSAKEKKKKPRHRTQKVKSRTKSKE